MNSMTATVARPQCGRRRNIRTAIATPGAEMKKPRAANRRGFSHATCAAWQRSYTAVTVASSRHSDLGVRRRWHPRTASRIRHCAGEATAAVRPLSQDSLNYNRRSSSFCVSSSTTEPGRVKPSKISYNGLIAVFTYSASADGGTSTGTVTIDVTASCFAVRGVM